MKPLLLSVDVAGPPDEVFAFFSDLDHAVERISGIVALEVLTPTSVGVGARFRETRRMLGKETSEELEITHWEPGAGYRVEGDACGSHFRTDVTFEARGNGTRVSTEVRFEPATFMAKLMSPMGALMAGTMRKCMQQDLDDLVAAFNARDRVGAGV